MFENLRYADGLVVMVFGMFCYWLKVRKTRRNRNK
jgi:hypothetical protein